VNGQIKKAAVSQTEIRLRVITRVGYELVEFMASSCMKERSGKHAVLLLSILRAS